MPESKRRTRGKQENARVEPADAETPEPPSDQEIEEDDPLQGEFLQMPEHIQLPDEEEDDEEPQPENLVFPEEHITAGGHVLSLPGPSQSGVVPSGSSSMHAVASGSSLGPMGGLHAVASGSSLGPVGDQQAVASGSSHPGPSSLSVIVRRSSPAVASGSSPAVASGSSQSPVSPSGLSVVVRRGSPAVASGSQSPSGSTLAGPSGVGVIIPETRGSFENLLAAQTGAIDRLNIATEAGARANVPSRPSSSANSERLQLVPEVAMEEAQSPERTTGDRIPDESEFFAAGPSRADQAPAVQDEQMDVSTSSRRRKSPRLLDLVCERCGGRYRGLKIPPRRPIEETDENADANSDSGSSSSRASSPALCPSCAPFGPPPSYSNQSLPSADSLSSALDMAGAPNVTIDASFRHELPEYSTERVPSAPPPVFTPVCVSGPQHRRPASAGYNPYSENRREMDSLRYSYALPGPSSSNSQYTRVSPSSTSGSPLRTSSRLSSFGQSSSVSPGRSSGLAMGAGTRGTSSEQSISPRASVSPVRVHSRSSSNENLAGPSFRRIPPFLLSSERIDIPSSARQSEPGPSGMSRYSQISPDNGSRLQPSEGPSRLPNPVQMPPQPGPSRRLSDVAIMPPPPSASVIEGFWSGDRDTHSGLESPERRREFSPSHGGRRRQSGSSGSGGSSAMRSTVMSPGRVTPYGHRASPRRRHLTGESDSGEENVPPRASLPRQEDDRSGAGPSNA